MNLVELLQDRVIVADGAMGTLLSAHGIAVTHPYDYANITHSSLVTSVHAEYVAAGAELIETNTYGANRIKLANYELHVQVKQINEAGVRAAREASAGRALVAGAVGPVGKPLAPIGMIEPEDARAAFREQILALLEAGVDALLLETFADIHELEIAFEVASELAQDVPVICHKTFIEDGETLAEGLPLRVAEELKARGASFIGSNCTVGPQRMLGIVRQMAQVEGVAVVAMPTAGMPQNIDGQVMYDMPAAYFGRYGRNLAEAGARIVGGCCGTTPAHIKAVADALRGFKPVAIARTAAAVRERPKEREAVEIDQRSAFAKKLGKKYVVSVELDLPRGTDISKVLQGAEALRDHGCDCIDISDGARARLRMNPMVASHIIQERVGIDVMMHFCCRDRNMLAIQADLLGCHALGLRNILTITGDPAQIGDYPSASSVYDVDSVGMVRILRMFNDGQDLGGNSIGEKTHFLVAVAFNPLAPNLDAERRRLGKKAEEGAMLIYTQPIFEERILDIAVEAAAEHSLPLLVGILPLRSSRHAEFMQNEVPGIEIPENMRAAIAGLGEEDARNYGIDQAREFLIRSKSKTQGCYLMPPFGNYRTAAQVMEAL
ncbi:MAG: bifunctional homocysteine S-methyltransferase/methylenetetrahydrofolate reductase [Armatimonadetes bacterium]|nr:bifunctional homocysteine S-methyltransferase/methylenetetrahydrofolate reductase [Armatimonadota bacterium]